MIPKPDESPLAIDVHWLGRFVKGPKKAKKKGPKLCPERISETSGAIFMIPKPDESPLAIDVHWLGRFVKGPINGPKGPKRPQTLSGAYLGN